jgi:hypothetical protein
MAKLCTICVKRRPGTGSKGLETSSDPETCNYCHEEGGWENTHSDYGHEAILAKFKADGYQSLTEQERGEWDASKGCWICHPELNLAQQPTKAASSAPKKQGARRPQFNHKGHHHPQTPAARRACKEAFWAIVKAAGTTDEAIIAKAQAEWDAYLDGHGKPVNIEKALAAKPGGGWATVTPRGPKGGVINKLKEGKPKAGKKMVKKPLSPATPGSYEITFE